MDTYAFLGVPFVLLMPQSGETPYWAPTVDATDRKLIGTDRFERNVRSIQWTLEVEAWIEPTADPDAARLGWTTMQTAYALGTVGVLTTPIGTEYMACITAFTITPRKGGGEGYRGKIVFGLPSGMGGV